MKFQPGDKVVNITAGEETLWNCELPLHSIGEIVGVDSDGDYMVAFQGFDIIQYFGELPLVPDVSEVVPLELFDSPLWRALE